jgi:hypothetical protein
MHKRYAVHSPVYVFMGDSFVRMTSSWKLMYPRVGRGSLSGLRCTRDRLAYVRATDSLMYARRTQLCTRDRLAHVGAKDSLV